MCSSDLHVARMSDNRLPRRMLTAWVDHPRPRGKPHRGYGHFLIADLNRAGIVTERTMLKLGRTRSWVDLAQDRIRWRKIAAGVYKKKNSYFGKDLNKDVELEGELSKANIPTPRPDADASWSHRLRPRGSKG